MSVPVVSGALCYTSQQEDHDPNRALAAAVILQGIKDYCQARKDQITPKNVWIGTPKRKERIMSKTANSRREETELFLMGRDCRVVFFDAVGMAPLSLNKLETIWDIYSHQGSISQEAAATFFRRRKGDRC